MGPHPSKLVNSQKKSKFPFDLRHDHRKIMASSQFFFSVPTGKTGKIPKSTTWFHQHFFSALNHHEIFKGEMGEIPRDLGLQSGHVPEFAEHIQQRVHQHLSRATDRRTGQKFRAT